MIYTKVNLREFVDCVNSIVIKENIYLPFGSKFIVQHRDGEYYRGYQWSLGVEKPDGGICEFSTIGNYGSPRYAAENLLNEIINNPQLNYTTFWNYPEFRELVRDIES